MTERTDQVMTRAEVSLLLYFETCAVDRHGLVDMRRINEEDHKIAVIWNRGGFIRFGRVRSDWWRNAGDSSNKRHQRYWCVLSDEAWERAQQERRARAKRGARVSGAFRLGLDVEDSDVRAVALEGK